MQYRIYLNLALTAILAPIYSLAQPCSKGYYKDVFNDSGIRVTSRSDLPAVRYLGLSMESFISAKGEDGDVITAIDSMLQKQLIEGSEMDENGILLYPDGAPRFRVLYVNGGSSFSHGESLGHTGIERIKQFVANGGSYVGTCAGSALSSTGIWKDTHFQSQEYYFGIWPGVIRRTELAKTYTGMNIPGDSPLLRYYDFGGDLHIDSMRHNLGNHAYTSFNYPQETEVLATYETDTMQLERAIGGEPGIWAYKPYASAGRAVMCGSHPEAITKGERLHLMSAMLRYAMDGNGIAKIKANLQNGLVRTMNKNTHDGMPDYTKIGDKQYHHFTFKIPKHTEKVTITLASVPGYTNYDLYLLARKDGFAFKGESDVQDLTFGVDKTIEIEQPQSGTWYVSVFCDTSVDAMQTKYGVQYTGRTDVLNGVPYTIRIDY